MTPCVLNETSLWWFNRTQRIVAAPDKYVTIAKNAQFFLLNLLHVALEHGLILVDTKYEFGKDSDGSILLIDEVHTPDSSRYWIAAHSHEERFQNGLEPQNVDKSFCGYGSRIIVIHTKMRSFLMHLKNLFVS